RAVSQPVAAEMLTGRPAAAPAAARSHAAARSLLFSRVTPSGQPREKGRAHEGQRSHVFHAQAAPLALRRGPDRPVPARAPLHERALAPGPRGIRRRRRRPRPAGVRGLARALGARRRGAPRLPRFPRRLPPEAARGRALLGGAGAGAALMAAPRVAVVGGGLAGLMTTIKLAEAGVPVDLFS